MRNLRNVVQHDACVSPAKKRGVREICAWKHFFVLNFCYFFFKKKVRALEVKNSLHQYNSILINSYNIGYEQLIDDRSDFERAADCNLILTTFISFSTSLFAPKNSYSL